MIKKFVHAADIHLDSPLRGLERYEGAPVAEVRGATRRALENLVDLCLTEEASLLLIAGDLYDGDWRDYGTGLFFAFQMARLTREGVKVVLVRGNHDAASRISRRVRLPEGAHDLSTKSPQTLTFDDLGIAIHGRGYAQAAVMEDLSAEYPDPIDGFVNVGLLHTALDGREGHALYAPCSAEALASRGYDYWALGHVHRREIVRRDPWVVFPGNLQGRHARELGPKGAMVATVDDGEVTRVDFVALDTVRWIEVDVDASDCGDAYEVVERARAGVEREAASASERILAVRLRISGASNAHASLAAAPEELIGNLRSAIIDLDADAWVERVGLDTRCPIDVDALRARPDAVGDLLRSIAELGEHPEGLPDIRACAAEMRAKLPREALARGEMLDLDDVENVKRLFLEVEQLLLPRFGVLAEGR
jgi:DNA repair exonuclease SbcCD nuclease subunit